MHFTTYLTGAAALSSASASVITRRQQTPSSQCAEGVHLIVVGGANSTNPYDDGRLAKTRDSVLRAIPGSTHATAPYDKVEPTNGKLNPGAVPEGEQNFNQYITSYAQSCPDTKIITMAYSAGAIITQLAMCTGVVDQSYAPNPIIANILFGDQSRVPGQPYNRGTCVANGGKQQLASPEACGNFADVTASWCDVNDPQCCGGPPSAYQIHLSYPNKYTDEATEFAVNQFQQSGGSIGGGEEDSGDEDDDDSDSTSTVAFPTATASNTDAGAGFGFPAQTATSTASVDPSVASAFLSSASELQDTESATMMMSSMMMSSALPTTYASSAISSAATDGAGFAGVATESAASAGAAATSAAASGASAAASSTSTLAPFDPNGSAMVMPSTSLITTVLVGMMVLIGATIL